MATQRALVVGGSGYLGSAICRACIARGWSVVSLSRQGEPASDASWTKKVEWIQGDAFDETTLKRIMPSVTSVVHTLGILLETDYKSSGLSSLLSGVASGLRQSHNHSKRSANPLAAPGPADPVTPSFLSSSRPQGQYERINRDSALAVLRAYLETCPDSAASSSAPSTPDAPEFPFVYISAEDVFRPFIPPRYILTKREAESRIQRLSETARSMVQESLASDNEFERLEKPERLIRPVYIRPSLIYDPQTRPPTALPAALLGISSSIQARLPTQLRAQTASAILSSLNPRRRAGPLPPASDSLANLLSIPPIHVDTVADAVCRSIVDHSVSGIVGVNDMNRLIQGKMRRSDFSAPQTAPQASA